MKNFNPGYLLVTFLFFFFFGISCKRDPNNVNPPIVQTTAANSLLPHMVETGGSIVSNTSGTIKMRGVCWGKTPKPDTSQHRKAIKGAENFVVVLFGLAPATRYYYRAFIVNENGLIYGDEKEFVTLENGPTVTDIDGNEYQTVEIGTQTWMKENLKVTRFSNGDPIPTGLNAGQWDADTNGAYAVYNNEPEYDAVFGKLYNWYAVKDPRNVCPTGWHVPSYNEWRELERAAGEFELAGSKMKAISALWNSPNEASSNETGFSGLPGGYRYSSYYFLNGDIGRWATSTSRTETSTVYTFSLINFRSTIGRGIYNRDGVSVRCIKD